MVTSDMEHAYLFGGFDGLNDLNDLYSFDYHNVNWTQIKAANPPSPRKTQSMFMYQNTIYIFAGLLGSVKINELWSFDVNTKVWTNITQSGHIPSPRYSASMWLTGSGSNTLAWLFGGSVNDFDAGTLESNELFSLNLTTFTWTMMRSGGNPQPRPDPRRATAVVAGPEICESGYYFSIGTCGCQVCSAAACTGTQVYNASECTKTTNGCLEPSVITPSLGLTVLPTLISLFCLLLIH